MNSTASTGKCLFLKKTTSSHLTQAGHDTAIAVSILSLITALSASMGNAMILYAFYRFQRLRSLPNILLTSLCVTDVLTGTIVQPLFATRRLQKVYKEGSICVIRLIYIFFANLCAGASIITIGLVTVDRCVAITLPYRYLSSVTAKVYIMMIMITWFVWTIFTILPFIEVLTMSQYFTGISSAFITTLVVVLISYALIYRVVVKQRRKIANVPCIGVDQGTGTEPDSRPEKRNNSEIFAVTKNENSSNNLHLKTSPLAGRMHGQTEQDYKEPAREVPNMKNLDTPALGQMENSTSLYRKALDAFAYDRQGTDEERRGTINDINSSHGDLNAKSGSTGNRILNKSSRRRIMHKLRMFTKERKRANTIAIVILTVFICYLPQITLLIIRANYGDNRLLLLLDAWADLLVYINSSLNPLIYCVRNREIRTALKEILKKNTVGP